MEKKYGPLQNLNENKNNDEMEKELCCGES